MSEILTPDERAFIMEELFDVEDAEERRDIVLLARSLADAVVPAKKDDTFYAGVRYYLKNPRRVRVDLERYGVPVDQQYADEGKDRQRKSRR